MAGNRGLTLFVLLLCCWHETKLQPINMTSDEILVREMLDPNKSSMAGKQRTASTVSTKLFMGKNSNLDENFQFGAPQNYHGLPDNSQFSLGSEDKIFNNEPSIDESYQIAGPEGYGKKNSQNEQYKKLSILDKILQNIGKTSAGNSLQ
uniref:protein SPACA7 n=1 Tax=Odobenus rosmarus divergens TaxID=9708 RepID=UPI00063C7B77|nr:PREDICTED: protein SPACA7 [Odobenus rosmarus divergens]